MREDQRKCLKCSSSPGQNPDTTLYRFPKPGNKNSLRCELWAKYCFPKRDWASPIFQQKLYDEHRMLCQKHFEQTSFSDYARKKLHRHASPTDKFDKVTTSVGMEINSEVLKPGPSKQNISMDITSPHASNDRLIKTVDPLIVETQEKDPTVAAKLVLEEHNYSGQPILIHDKTFASSDVQSIQLDGSSAKTCSKVNLMQMLLPQLTWFPTWINYSTALIASLQIYEEGNLTLQIYPINPHTKNSLKK